jgi:hypothetical protein
MVNIDSVKMGMSGMVFYEAAPQDLIVLICDRADTGFEALGDFHLINEDDV